MLSRCFVWYALSLSGLDPVMVGSPIMDRFFDHIRGHILLDRFFTKGRELSVTCEAQSNQLLHRKPGIDPTSGQLEVAKIFLGSYKPILYLDRVHAACGGSDQYNDPKEQQQDARKSAMLGKAQDRIDDREDGGNKTEREEHIMINGHHLLMIGVIL